jgi:hypothetical protein
LWRVLDLQAHPRPKPEDKRLETLHLPSCVSCHLHVWSSLFYLVTCGSVSCHSADEGLRCTACGTVGMAYGRGLSLATAGVASTFALVSKDQFGNLRDASSALVQSRVDADPSCGAAGTGRALSGNCTARAAVTPTLTSAAGVYRYSYTTDTKAPTTLTVGAMEVGGLFATYYAQADCTKRYNTLQKEGTGVASIEATAIGSGCTAHGTISATPTGGGAGSGFSGRFVQGGGAVGKVYIISAGVGYDAAPILSCCQQVSCGLSTFDSLPFQHIEKSYFFLS